MTSPPPGPFRTIGDVCDALLPEPHFAETHHRDIAASPEHVWAAIQHTDVSRSRVARMLLGARNVLAVRRHGHDQRDVPTGPASGVPLVHDPPRTLVRGMVGQWWSVGAGPGFSVTTREEFRDFAEPGYARALFAFQLLEGDLTRLVTHTRVRCTDEAALRTMRRYWRVIRPFSGLIRRVLLRQVARAASRRPT